LTIDNGQLTTLLANSIRRAATGEVPPMIINDGTQVVMGPMFEIFRCRFCDQVIQEIRDGNEPRHHKLITFSGETFAAVGCVG